MSQSVVVLEDAVIMRMLSNQAYVTAFPFLATYSAKLKKRKPGRKCNCGENNKITAVDFNTIRFSIFGMPNNSKLELKRMLGTAQIRLYYKNASQQVVKVTF